MGTENELVERIGRELVASMKARDAERTSALRMVRAALQNRAIEARGALGEDEVTQVLATLAKQRRESIEQYRAGGREDLAAKEERELGVIREFLPQPLGEEELREIVAAAVAETGATGPGDLGRVMAAVMPRVKGRADGRAVNALVRGALAGGDAA